MEASWTNVVTTPTLPVKHETKLQLSCEDNYSNKGDGEAECLDGTLSPLNTAPDCRGEKMNTLEISMFKIMMSSFYCGKNLKNGSKCWYFCIIPKFFPVQGAKRHF